MILILEDDPDRIRRFTRVLGKEAPGVSLRVWRDACRMAAEVAPHLPSARLISLDHDLEPGPGDPADLGDGMVVARALVRHPQTCPAIIHSSNGTRSGWMTGGFELGGWESHRAAPIGERWIEEHWRLVVRDLLGPRPR